MAWSQLKVGAGGWVTGIDVAADGTKVVRCDTYGAYALSPGETVWRLVLSATALPSGSGDYGFDVNGDPYFLGQLAGVYEICIAPSNNAIFYMFFNGRIYRSTNRGVTWTRTAFTQVTGCGPNGNGKTTSRKMAVDPINANIVFVGTPNNGLFKTTDGGATWVHDATVANAASNYGIIVAFDATSANVGGALQGIYVSSYGTGVYHSTNGGAGWTLLSTSAPPATHIHMRCSAIGVLWLTVSTGTIHLWKYASGAWTNSFASGSLDRVESIALDPTNVSNIYLGQDYGGLIISTDGGTNWSASVFTYDTRIATDIPWLQVTNENYMSNGDMMCDSSGRVWFAEGIGVWKSPIPPTAPNTWTSVSAGIEQLVATWACWPPGGHPSVCSWDRPCFYCPDLNAYPAAPQPGYNTTAIVHGWHVSYAPSNPSRLVGLFNYFGAEVSGYSTDGGANWTAFATYPPLTSNSQISGSIATKDGTTIVWSPSNQDGSGNHGRAYYSINGGTSWTAVSISGVPTTGEVGWGGSWNSKNYRLCVDANGDFYMYNNGAVADASYAGMYKSSNGSTWTRVWVGQLSSWSGSGTNPYGRGQSLMVRAVPGRAGHMFAAEGGPDNAIIGGFYHTTDGWTTSSLIANIDEVKAYGFGAPKPGGSGYPAVFIAGWRSGVWGIYRSDDECATWSQIGDFPYGNVDTPVTCVEGDPDHYGVVIVGFFDSGWALLSATAVSGLRFGLRGA